MNLSALTTFLRTRYPNAQTNASYFIVGLVFGYLALPFLSSSFAALGMFATPAILIGAGILAIFSRYFTLAATTAIVKYSIEFSLASAIKNIKINNDKADTNALASWLAVAQNGVMNKDCLQFKYQTGKSLADPLIASASNHWQAVTAPKWYQRWYQKLFANANRTHRMQSQTSLIKLNRSWQAACQIEASFKTNEKSNIQFSLWQRCILRLRQWVDIKWQFKGDSLNDGEAIVAALQNGAAFSDEAAPILANEPTTHFYMNSHPIPEQHKHTPLVLLKKYFTEEPATIFPEESEDKQATPKGQNKVANNKPAVQVPEHLRHWLGKLNVVHQVDQQQQQTQTAVQSVTETVSVAQSLQAEETHKWQDDSEQLDFRSVERTRELYFYSVESSARESLVGDSNDCFEFRVSKQALDMFEKGAGYIKLRDKAELSLDDLPLGFYLEKSEKIETREYLPNSKTHVAVLKYDEKFREYQLKHREKYVVSLRHDPAACTADAVDHSKLYNFRKHDDKDLFSNVSKALTKQDIIKRELKFSEAAQKYNAKIDMQSSREQKLEFLLSLQYYASNSLGCFIAALERIAEQDKENIDKYLDIFVKFSDKEICLWHYMLEHLLFLKFNDAQVEQLEDILKFSDVESAWLQNIATTGGYATGTFGETVTGLKYCFDYFKNRGLQLPTPPKFKYDGEGTMGFAGLKGMVECIYLAGINGGMAGQTVQAKYAGMLPWNMQKARMFLRAGYSVVHAGMYLEKPNVMWYDQSIDPYIRKYLYELKTFAEQFPELNDPSVIDKETFKKIKYIARADVAKETDYLLNHIALFLRFVSYHCHAETFQLAIAHLEEVVGINISTLVSKQINGRDERLSVINEKLQENWSALKTYALNLPTKLAHDEKNNESKSDYIAAAFANDIHVESVRAKKAYPKNDIDALLTKLKLDTVLAKKITTQLEKLNTYSLEFTKLEPDELAQQLKSAGAKENDDLKRLALLREAEFRLSGYKKWLRLEQAVAVLTALEQDCIMQIATSEGKTFILQLIGLLFALNGETVDIITHNESLAEEAGDGIKKLASLLDSKLVKVARKGESAEAIAASTLFYIDISTAVNNENLSLISDKKQETPRKATRVITDELDLILIDIQSKTTMQVSTGSEEASEDLIKFARALNAFCDELAENTGLKDKEKQFELLKSELSKRLLNNSYWQQIRSNMPLLKSWLKASVVSMGLTEKVDFIVSYVGLGDTGFSRPEVHIMHKDTTGHEDKTSRWGECIHQSVSVRMLDKVDAAGKPCYPELRVPGLSQVVAEGGVVSYLQTYPHRMGVTGTLGTPEIKAQIEKDLDVFNTYIFPRAKKAKPDNVNWPLHSQDNGKTLAIDYNRGYIEPPRYLPNHKSHWQLILRAIRRIQAQDKSALVFFDTIKECEAFRDFLQRNNVADGKLQILDDTHDDEKIRPAEGVVIERAKENGMTTICTAAGGRGTDFSKVDYNIITKPSLYRVFKQKAHRVARNVDLGVIYEIYNLEDFPDLKEDIEKLIQTAGEADVSQFSRPAFRALVGISEQRKQALDMLSIKERAPLRRFKRYLLEQYVVHVNAANADDKEQLSQAWKAFYGQVDLLWDEQGKGYSQQNEVVAAWQSCFQETSWAGEAVQAKLFSATTSSSARSAGDPGERGKTLSKG